MPVLAILIVIALVYHFVGAVGLILLAIATVLYLLLRGTCPRRHNPAPKPSNTQGRRR